MRIEIYNNVKIVTCGLIRYIRDELEVRRKNGVKKVQMLFFLRIEVEDSKKRDVKLVV